MNDVGDVGGFGEAANGENGPDFPVDIWDGQFPEAFEDRLEYFDRAYRATAQELFDYAGSQYDKWRKKTTEWGLTAGKDKWEFLYHCVIIHKERLYPLIKAWPSVFGLTREDIRANFKVYQHFEGTRTAFISNVISGAFNLHGYALELKEDEIIAQIGMDFGIADWIQTNLNEARDRSKLRARIKVIVTTVTLALLTYGASEALGIRASVQTATTEAYTQYVKGSLWAKIKGWIKVIQAGLDAFLTAIHYDTLHAVHRIAYLTSKDYRTTMNKVYREISKASESLGLGPYYLQLFLQNARGLILAVSTSFGRSYDMAEMEWLATFDEYLSVFNTRAFRYRDDPSLLFYDLEQLVERPACDAKGAGAMAVLDSLKGLLTETENTVVNIKKVSDSVDKLVFQLPDDIKKQIEPHTSKITQKVDDFIVKTYEPYIGTLNNIIVEIRGQNETMRGDLKGIIGRLARPADYLLEIDNMEWGDKIEQQRKIEDLNSRSYREDMEALNETIEPEYEHLSSIAEAWEKVTITPIEFPTEIETPIHPPGKEPEKRQTWFVGDY